MILPPRTIHLVKNVGTVQLLQWMKNLNEEDRTALLEYVGNLEQSQQRLAQAIIQIPTIEEK